MHKTVEASGKRIHIPFMKEIEDEIPYNKMESCTQFVDGEYQVPMLWKDSVCLPNNKPLAEKRFNLLLKRLESDEQLRNKYIETMESYVKLRYANKMKMEEEKLQSQHTWYLPHHPDFNPTKPGKLRVALA